MKRRAGFGLLEMLVAVAIVAVLGTVVFQSGRAMIARGEAAHCIGNLRQIGTALQLYLADHNMKMPQAVAARASIHDDESALDTVLEPYMESQKAFACPADGSIAEETGTSYYYWGYLFADESLSNIIFLPALLNLEDLSRIPLASDKEGWHKYSAHNVNFLYADGHVTERLELVVGE